MTRDAERALLSSVPTDLYIAGVWRPASSSGTFDVHDPATGDVIAAVADATPDDGEAALAAAHAAQEGWGRTPPRERAELLRAAFDAVTARADDVALLMTLEMGKPLEQSRAEVTYGAEFLRWFSEQAAHIDGGYLRAPNGANRILVVKKPVGPSLLITPWNFPLAMATRKIAPALAAGCTVVIKPASLTPLTTHLFVKVLHDVGVPPGVVNLISTSRSGDVTGPLITDPRLRKLSFTGSTEVGRSLLAAASEQVLRTSMELGGNAPFLVFADADLDAAVDGAVAAKMRNMGEACTAANRFLVQADVAEEFARRLAERLGQLRLGRGTDDGVDVGPLVEEKARDKVDELVTAARDDGARVLVGGAVPDGPGWFYPPTVLSGVGEDARLVREEIFGPVAPVVTFTDEDDAVRLANATEYGLVAYAYTRDVARALRLAERVETGMLGINAGVISDAAAPFGGVKQSGIGREGGAVGIEEYLETTYVGIADPFGS